MRPATERSEQSALGLVASTKVSRKPDGKQPGRLNWTTSTGLSLPISFLRPGNTVISATGAHLPCPQLAASPSASPARTFLTWRRLSETSRNEVLLASAADSSLKSWRASPHLNPLGWSLKTCRPCSISTIAETFRQSSQNYPNAGMWDSGECLTLNISESPKSAAAFSWSRVLDDTQAPSFYLTPGQWNRYLHRLARTGSQNKRILGLAILLRLQTSLTDAPAGSIWAVNFSLLRKTDGVRWLSGPERLRYMGFAADWMRPTLKRLMPQGTHSPPLWRTGLLKF